VPGAFLWTGVPAGRVAILYNSLADLLLGCRIASGRRVMGLLLLLWWF